MSEYHITVNNSSFENHSGVIHNEYGRNDMTIPHDEAILQELQKLQKDLENVEPLISNSILELQKAIQEQNRSKISNIIRQLSSGVAAPFLANMASGSLLAFLGIS